MTHSESLSLEQLSPDGNLAGFEVEWDELLADSERGSIFQTWDWMDAWMRHFGQRCQPSVWAVRDREAEGRLVGLAPWISIGRSAGRVLRWRELRLMGAQPAAADHLDLIVRRGYEARVWPHFERSLAAALKEHDVIDLDGVRADGRVLGPWIASWPQAAQRVRRIPCPYIRLGSDWQGYLATLSKRRRADFGRGERRLEQLFPERVAYREVKEVHELPAAFDALVRLHQITQRRLRHDGLFSDPRMEPFHREIADRFLRKDRLRFHLLLLGNDVTAADYGFRYGGVRSDFSTGFDPQYSGYGTGRQLLGHCIRDSIAEGDCEYDFLRGAETYKLELTQSLHETLSLKLGLSARGRAVVGIGHVAELAARESSRMRRRAARLGLGVVRVVARRKNAEPAQEP